MNSLSKNLPPCHRIVANNEVDTIGETHFHQLLRWCQEAYEEFLNANSPYAGMEFTYPFAPPTKTTIKYRANEQSPLMYDDMVIQSTLHQQGVTALSVGSTFTRGDEIVAEAITRQLVQPTPRPESPPESLPTRSWLRWDRTVQPDETDATDVMHFHHLLRWCYEAFRKSLDAFGVSASQVFENGLAAFPIIYCTADYRQSIRRDDRLMICLRPSIYSVEDGVFSVRNTFSHNGEVVATASTQHMCIHRFPERRRQPLFDPHDPENPATSPIYKWLKASDPALAATGDTPAQP